MPNYQNGKIYMIESLEGKCRYYGSTVQKLSVRMAEHRKHYKNNLYVSSSKVVCFNDAKIFLVENYPCNSKEELNKKEGEYIRNNDCVNNYVSGRTKKEYYDDNKNIIKKKSKTYYEENKQTIRQKNKDKYIKNKDVILNRCKKYRENNKEKINKSQNENVKCICGVNINKSSLRRHMKSKKHMKLMEKNNL